jgi:hypothetical protein
MASTEYVPGQGSRTAGIDLASQPEDTGLCVIDWATRPAFVREEDRPELGDDALLDVLADERVVKVAIDAPFGFPMAFVDALTTYQAGGSWLALDHGELRFRATEHALKMLPKVQPLSPITDQLVWPAMRCARLLSTYALRQGTPVDRAGSGTVVEVYPAAALRIWGIYPTDAEATAASYKGNGPQRREQRMKIVDALQQRTSGVLELQDQLVQRCIDDDDQLDALICAVIARAVVNGNVQPIPEGSKWAATREGWIAIPRDDITLSAALASPAATADSEAAI